MGWRAAADATLVLHLAFIVFTVLGGFWARRRRIVALPHLLVVGYGVLIEEAGFLCPLTPLENHFRRRAGQAGYEGGFLEHYLVSVIYPGGLTGLVRVVLIFVLIAVTLLAYQPWLSRRIHRQISRPQTMNPKAVRGFAVAVR